MFPFGVEYLLIAHMGCPSLSHCNVRGNKTIAWEHFNVFGMKWDCTKIGIRVAGGYGGNTAALNIGFQKLECILYTVYTVYTLIFLSIPSHECLHMCALARKD